MTESYNDRISSSVGAVSGAVGAGIAASNLESAVFIGLVTGITVLAGYIAEYLVREKF